MIGSAILNTIKDENLNFVRKMNECFFVIFLKKLVKNAINTNLSSERSANILLIYHWQVCQHHNCFNKV